MGNPDLSLIRRFRSRAEQALPGRITRVVLFGSRARREPHAHSDWDVAVFLKDTASSQEALALADAAYDLIVKTGQMIHPIVLAEDGRGASPLLLDRIDTDFQCGRCSGERRSPFLLTRCSVPR